MKTKRFQECKVDAVPIEKIAQERPSKKRGVLQVFKFYVRSSGKIKETNFAGRKIAKDVVLFSAVSSTHLTVRSDEKTLQWTDSTASSSHFRLFHPRADNNSTRENRR